MIKRILIILIAVIVNLLYSIYLLPSVFATEDVPTIIINDTPVDIADTIPFIKQNDIMIPVKYIAEAMGLNVKNWGSETGDCYVDDEIYGTQLIIRVMENDARMSVRGNMKSIDESIPPMNVGDYKYVPLRPFAAAFDYIVQWDEYTKTATLINELDTPFFEGKEVNTTHSLLNNRLIISMPENAENQNAWHGGIMGAATDSEYEVNLLLSGNGQTITVNVSELYLYSTGDIQKDASLLIDIINAENNEYPAPVLFDLSNPVKIDDIEFIVMQPISIKSNYNSDYFIMSALVRNIDNTLMFVKVYADAKAMKYPEDCINIAQKIVNSIKSGNRSLIVDGQKLNMGDYTIQIAPGYVPKFSQGVDFDVWYFNKLVSIGNIRSSFGIYFGGNTGYDSEKKPVKTAREIVLSRIVKWRIYAKTPELLYGGSYAETIILTDISVDFPYYYATYIDIFASPSSESDWKIIREMVRSLHDVNGKTTLMIWIFYGIIFAIIIFIILLIIRKRKKYMRSKKI